MHDTYSACSRRMFWSFRAEVLTASWQDKEYKGGVPPDAPDTVTMVEPILSWATGLLDTPGKLMGQSVRSYGACLRTSMQATQDFSRARQRAVIQHKLALLACLTLTHFSVLLTPGRECSLHSHVPTAAGGSNQSGHGGAAHSARSQGLVSESDGTEIWC